MSNVLIGIIGVILFIGLALAGALILGEDFKTSSSITKASQTIAQLQQVTHAIGMYQMKTGNTIAPNAELSSLSPRYLKTSPILPTGFTAARIYDAYGRSTTATTAMPAYMVASSMGNTDAAKAACEAIQEQNTGSTAFVTASAAGAFPATPTTGCFRSSVQIYEVPTGYIAYSRLW